MNTRKLFSEGVNYDGSRFKWASYIATPQGPLFLGRYAKKEIAEIALEAATQARKRNFPLDREAAWEIRNYCDSLTEFDAGLTKETISASSMKKSNYR